MVERWVLNGPSPVILLAVVLGVAQVSAAQHPAVDSFDVRLLIRQSGGRVEEASGHLLADPNLRALRFEAPGALALEMPFASVVALHVEKDGRDYLTVYYKGIEGGSQIATFQLRSHAAHQVAEALARQTGHGVDRVADRRSFLGIPIRAGVGDRVIVTDRTGATVTGMLTALSAGSIALRLADGRASVIAEETVARITLVRRRKRDAVRGAVAGGIVGAGVCGAVGVAVSAASGGGVDSAVLPAAATCGLIWAGVGAAVGAAIPSRRARQARDIYLWKEHP